MSIEFDPHQIRALKKLGNGKILTGGVGSGKSRVACMYYFVRLGGGRMKVNGVGEYAPMTRPIPLYIITSAKKRDSLDWQGELTYYGLTPEEGKVVIDSWNNIQKYVGVKEAFFIFDEQRLVGNGVWVKSFYKIARVNKWIMLSATPGDVWVDYIPVFVAHGFYKNRTEFLYRHAVYSRFTDFPKIERYVDISTLEKHRKAVLVDMPYKRATTRHIIFVNVDYDRDAYKRVWKDRWHVFEDRPIKDVGELFQAVRRVVNGSPEKLDKVLELQQKHPRLIIFYNFNYELDALRTLADRVGTDISIAEWNGHKHEEVPETDQWLYLVQYLAGAEAWECVTTDAIVFYSLNYSYRLTEQAQGRIDRMNTRFVDLYYYFLKTMAPIDSAIWRAISRKKNFSESAFVGKKEV